MNTVDDLIGKVKDDMGYDAYYIYLPEERHLIAELASAFAAALLIEYFRGIMGPTPLDPLEIGTKHRGYILAFVDKVRGGDPNALNAHVKDLHEELPALLNEPFPQVSEDVENSVREKIKLSLSDIGMPEDVAANHAEDVARTGLEYLGRVRD